MIFGTVWLYDTGKFIAGKIQYFVQFGSMIHVCLQHVEDDIW